MPSNALHLPTENRIFYHGTSKRNARHILHHGFRDRSWTADNPKFRLLAKRGVDRIMHGGALGNGTYLTCNWKTGLFFGPVLFRVELQPGTRLLRLDVPPDLKILDRLKREFGHEILIKSPLKVMPRNKRLTLDEAVQLARHHQSGKYHASMRDGSWDFHQARQMEVRSILIRYGIHGWGESTELDGIAIFATDRITPREVVLCLPTRQLADACNDNERTDGPHASLDAMIQTMHRATNPGANNTRKWFHEANRILEGRARQPPKSTSTSQF